MHLIAGDYFNEGIYDIQIKVSRVPMLPWHCPKKLTNTKAIRIMNEHVVCVRMKENVEYIVNMLRTTTYNGFPVVDQVDGNNRHNGRVCGLILRSQLIVILMKSLFEEGREYWEQTVSIETFRNEYPRYPSINDVHINAKTDQRNSTINMELFMNPSPHRVNEHTSMPRIFKLFRHLGLRHLIVIDGDNRVKGMITRKDFLK